MNTHAQKSKENVNQSIPAISQNQKTQAPTLKMIDKRPETLKQKKLQEMANNSYQDSKLKDFHAGTIHGNKTSKAAQLKAMTDKNAANQPSTPKKENKTGLPENLKKGIEGLSGFSLDDVKVHRNSNKPRQMNAHAYAQGNVIHIGTGQEKHLPHEAWHVVQQKQGRVKPTMQLKNQVAVNDDAGLEKEADIMGNRALSAVSSSTDSTKPLQMVKEKPTTTKRIVQRVKDIEIREVKTDPVMLSLYEDMIPILQQIAQMPITQEDKAKSGQEKGESMVEGASEKVGQLWEALKHPEEAIQAAAEKAAKKAMKDYWKSLTPEEQLNLALEGVGAGVSILKNLGNAALEQQKGTKKSSGPKKKGILGGGLKGFLSRGGNKGGDEVSKAFIEGISQITADDLQTLLKVWQEKKNVQKEIDKARSDFDETIMKIGGWGGKKIGQMQGAVVDIMTQRKLKATLQPKLGTLIDRYEFVRKEIIENKDGEWYNDELAVYDQTLHGLHVFGGPMLVLFSKDALDFKGMTDCKQKSAQLLNDLASAKSARESAAKGGLLNKAKKFLGL